ncbi:efflux RND transporter periplasmic adaptor subunit [Mucilaginibacter sp. PAMB04274]|uniref:efflux RND transporter periplasmic adaptor subunit n=1 Tax=Mucilaginibacter sp. PAMB04274 TaxID=3138568 RepID=UPI0031F6FFAE
MDRIIEKKRWNNKRVMTIAGIVAVVALVTGSIVFTSGKSKLNVDAERITISEVKKGSFQEIIPLNGIVLPITTIYLDAVEGGRVEKLFVEDGATMEKGQPILKLANTDLELNLANEETAVFNVLTQMQISHDNARQNTISKLNQMAEVESNLKEADRVYKLNKRLYDQKAIGLQEFQKSENDYSYAVRRKRLTTQILNQDSTAMNQQTQQSKESYAHMKATLELMRKKVGDLIVRAPVDGQLTSLDAEIGQSKQKGGRLGQIDVLSGFKVRVDVDEHYITRVFNGQMGEFTLGDKTYKLKIKKVFTQVSNGRFQVDMQFAGALPKDIRRGQSLQIRLALSDETQAVLVPKGGFYQQTGGNWIFKLSEDGKTAYRMDIQLGRQNPDYYEVMQGLKPGDRVVTSSYENYGDMQELIIK